MYTLEDIHAVDPEIAAAITAEFDRQNSHIELIASELGRARRLCLQWEVF